MSSKIQIRNGRSLERGQEHPVEILVTFEKPTKVRGIRAVFLGHERTQASYVSTESDGKGGTKTVTKTATQYVEVVRQEYLLLGQERTGFFSRIGDSIKTIVGGGSHELIQPGEKSFTIDVMIPRNAPASMKGKKCQVVYEVQVSVDIPIKIDWYLAKELPLASTAICFDDIQPVHVVFPDEKGRSFWDKTFGKNVTLNLAIDRNKLQVGEKAKAMLTVDAPEPLKVNKIQSTLVGTESTQADGHKDSVQVQLPLGDVDSPGVISSESVHEFDITIPELDWPYSQIGSNFEIAWMIEVRLDVPWAKDPVICVPIELYPIPRKTD